VACIDFGTGRLASTLATVDARYLQAIKIKASKKIAFRASKDLKEAI